MSTKGRPRLPITQESRLRRNQVMRYMYKVKRQLLAAYVSKDPDRIARAKLHMAKRLREICESRDLGPAIPFKFGYTLELYIEMGFDPTLSPKDFNTENWHELARKLEHHALELIGALDNSPHSLVAAP